MALFIGYICHYNNKTKHKMIKTNWDLSSRLGCQLALNDELKTIAYHTVVIETATNKSIPSIEAKIEALKVSIEFRDTKMKEINEKMQELAQSMRPTDTRIQYTLNAGSCTVPFDLEVKVERFKKEIELIMKGVKEAEYALKFHTKQAEELKEMLGDEKGA